VVGAEVLVGAGSGAGGAGVGAGVLVGSGVGTVVEVGADVDGVDVGSFASLSAVIGSLSGTFESLCDKALEMPIISATKAANARAKNTKRKNTVWYGETRGRFRCGSWNWRCLGACADLLGATGCMS
jgi:hypothetical protein